MLEAFRNRQFEAAERKLAALRQVTDQELAQMWNLYEDRIGGYKTATATIWHGRAMAEFG